MPMPRDARSDALEEHLRLEWRKRVLYQLASTFAALVIAVSWVSRQPGDVIVERGYPFVLVALAGFVVVLRARRFRLWPIEVTMFVLLAILIMGRLLWHLHFAGSLDEHLLILTGGHYWAVGTLIVGSFVMLDRRGGLAAGAATLAASSVLIATAVWRQGGDVDPETILYLVRVHGFLAALLTLTAAIAGMREQLHRALARAEALDERATTDHMTGLANRWAGQERLAAERAAALRYDRPLAIVLVDLDHFKDVNDDHGHAMGDEVLARVAEVLRDAVREVDLVVRWGGEEFLIIAPNADLAAAARLAERCRREIAAARPGGLPLTATFGIAQLRTDEDLDALMHRADQHLYAAKDQGRDRVGGIVLQA